MKAIWKFQFAIRDLVRVQMPVGAKVLSIQVHGDVPCIWALVDTTALLEQCEFMVVGTGHVHNAEWFDALTHVGTFQQGPFVWHVFEVAS